jgi:heme exporter protein A
MLLDEPETGLDQQAISMVWEALQKEGERKRSILLTTHNLERGLEMGERLLILDRGTIVYQGLKEDLNLAGLKEAYEHSTRVRG